MFARSMIQLSRRDRDAAVLVLCTLAVFMPTNASTQTPSADTPIRIGVLYRQSPTGIRFSDGVKAAIETGAHTNRFELVEVKYGTEKAGVDSLLAMVKEERVNVVLGPTESGVFARALELKAELESHRVPVVSSQVTAKIGNNAGGMFFRTNLNIERRAQAVRDFLNKRWISSIAVLYVDNEFGLRAEYEFRRELRGKRQSNYISFSYAPEERPRFQIEQILQQRPAAVGIFGEREQISEIVEQIRSMNEGPGYHPVYFTVIDARLVDLDHDEIFYVSVMRPEILVGESTDWTPPPGFEANDFEHYDDVNALAFDTTNIVCGILDACIATGLSGTKLQECLRHDLEALIGGFPPQEASLTGIGFGNRENTTPANVYHRRHGELTRVDLSSYFGPVTSLAMKLKMLSRRYGYTPWINAVLIVVLVSIFSVLDIKKYWESSVWRAVSRGPFVGLLGMNLAIVLGVYVFMAENGQLSYGSILAAVVVALTPSALLRTTLFDSSHGRAMSLGQLYDQYVFWTYERIAISKYLRDQRWVNLVAYHNSQDGMQSAFVEMYQDTPTDQRVRMLARVEAKLKDGESWLDRRKILARMLLLKFSLKALEERGLAPTGVAENFTNVKKGTKITIRDPEAVIRDLARICVGQDDVADRLDDKIDEILDKLRSKDRRAELKAAQAEQLKGVMPPQGILRQTFIFYFLLGGYDLERLITDGILDYDQLAPLRDDLHPGDASPNDDDIGESETGDPETEPATTGTVALAESGSDLEGPPRASSEENSGSKVLQAEAGGEKAKGD